MTTPYAQTQGLVTGFIGHPYSEKPELYWEASPAKYLHEGLPPTLIFQGTSDNLLPQSQSNTLKARLDRLGVPAELLQNAALAACHGYSRTSQPVYAKENG